MRIIRNITKNEKVMKNEIEQLEQRIEQLDKEILILEHSVAQLTRDIQDKELAFLYITEVVIRALEIIKKNKYTKTQYGEAIKEAEVDILIDSVLENTKYGFLDY